jgi:hypothetical protein
MGGGRSIRYRLITQEDRESPLPEPSPIASACAKASADRSEKGEAIPQGKGPIEPGSVVQPKKEGILPVGLRNLLKKVLKG